METEETEVKELSPLSGFPRMDRSEVDMQIATAHRYPRSLSTFKKTAMAMATADQETAESCFYALPRKDKNGQVKNIEGPSVRLAEIIASSWGNLRSASRIIEETDKYIVAQAMAHDLQNNVAISIEVRRRITDKYGKKYSDDMVGVTANAASSIALRNAIFKVIPKTFIESVYEAAKKVAIGDASTLSARRQKAIEHFQKMGVGIDQILARLEKVGIEDIGLKDLETLIGLATAIKEGETTIDETFPPTGSPKATGASKTENLAQNLKAKMDVEKKGPADAVAQ